MKPRVISLIDFPFPVQIDFRNINLGASTPFVDCGKSLRIRVLLLVRLVEASVYLAKNIPLAPDERLGLSQHTPDRRTRAPRNASPVVESHVLIASIRNQLPNFQSLALTTFWPSGVICRNKACSDRLCTPLKRPGCAGSEINTQSALPVNGSE